MRVRKPAELSLETSIGMFVHQYARNNVGTTERIFMKFIDTLQFYFLSRT
jgi:hypothetical protein